MSSSTSELLRIDPLTGCRNFLGFLETCLDLPVSDSPGDIPLGIHTMQYSAILFVDMNGISFLNETKGRSYGDSAIRWMGLLLGEESNSTVYRLGGDEFGVLLNMESYEKYAEFLRCTNERIHREAKLLGILETPADIALILYERLPTSLDTLLLHMGEAMVRAKNNEPLRPMIFHASDFKIPDVIPHRWKFTGDSDVSYTSRWLSHKSIFQVLEMGRSLDRAQQEALTDLISSLPNLKAAMLHLEQTLQHAIANKGIFSILMLDGDNIRIYNTINYAAGDQIIRDMCSIYKKNLRPNDFVARWRSGDEFLVILPDTSTEDAAVIGERIRLAVKNASQAWPFPVTNSIGVVTYPVHGETMDALIDKVEAANKRAKDQGKDQVVTAD